jgi:hypothetical protein
MAQRFFFISSSPLHSKKERQRINIQDSRADYDPVPYAPTRTALKERDVRARIILEEVAQTNDAPQNARYGVELAS